MRWDKECGLADVGDAVGVRVSERAAEDLAVVDEAVVVAVGGPFDQNNGKETLALVVGNPVIPWENVVREAAARCCPDEIAARAVVGIRTIVTTPLSTPRGVRPRLTSHPSPITTCQLRALRSNRKVRASNRSSVFGCERPFCVRVGSHQVTANRFCIGNGVEETGLA